LALVPDCVPPCAGVPMKMRVKFAGAAATVQSCEITSGEDRGLHDARASTNARTRADARMKGENFIHASLRNLHGPDIRRRADHAFRHKKRPFLQWLFHRILISKPVARVYFVKCLKDDCQEYSSGGNTFLVNTNKVRIAAVSNQQLAISLKKAPNQQRNQS
jgi:hypothetical protein